MSDSAPDGEEPASDGMTKHLTGNALGAGLALVVLPSVALYFGLERFSLHATEGLPVMAVFGIMILFGSLALVATLFRRLGLANRGQALALPEGSIRATIALSLIVLFAIIAIMLYRSSAEPYMAKGLTFGERKALIEQGANRVIVVMEEACANKAVAAAMASGGAASASSGTPSEQASDSDAAAGVAAPSCLEKDQRFTVALRAPASPEASDLAKQLLILVGTLMTSVTSFYFAGRGAETAKPDTPDKDEQAAKAAKAQANTRKDIPGEQAKEPDDIPIARYEPLPD